MSGAFLFFGYGYTAAALAPLLRASGWRLAATARTPEKAAALEDEGIAPALWTEDGLKPEVFDKVEGVLVSTPPQGRACPALAAAAGAIAERASALRWIGYLSTNGVYGDHGGAWVDEDSALRPTTERARQRIAAEAEWAGFGAEWAAPVKIFRLPGIYGPGRSAIDSVLSGRARRIVKPGQVFNRMHVEDIAAALLASLENPDAAELFNFADDEPAAQQEVIEYAAKLLGVEPPPSVAFEDAELSDMARSFYADNKRVSNRRMKEALGVRLAYPTYREGLAAIADAVR
jgi:nucleoside-diphosphate-sugar epimerase